MTDRRRIYALIICTQCLGMLSMFLFGNGFFLNYLTQLGCSSAFFAFFCATPALVGACLLMPSAYLSDRIGKIRTSLLGQGFLLSGILLFLSAGSLGPGLVVPILLLGLLLFSVAGSLQGSCWFALLNPLIPSERRGRFFGTLRATFLSVSILFTFVISVVLERNPSPQACQSLLAVVVLANLVRFFTLARIPELEKEHQHGLLRGQRFVTACREAISTPGYLRFNVYAFLLVLFSAAIPTVFALMQKDVFLLSPGGIMLAGNAMLLGSLLGALAGGRLVDRFGTRAVLRSCHGAYLGVLLFMLTRALFPWPLLWHACLCGFGCGVTGWIAGIATSSETLGLIPRSNQSLSTSIHLALQNLGVALSGFFVSQAIRTESLPQAWSWRTMTFGAYDALLVFFFGALLLVLLAVRLIPRVYTSGSIPRSGIPKPL